MPAYAEIGLFRDRPGPSDRLLGSKIDTEAQAPQSVRTIHSPAPMPSEDIQLEFPILVYREEGSWIAQSLLTSTISVRETPMAAVEEICRLLLGEIQDAMTDAQGNLQRALELVACPAPQALWERFYHNAKPFQTDCTPTRIDHSNVAFTPREAGTLSYAGQ